MHKRAGQWSEATDHEIVEAALEGDAQAFEEIYHRYARFVATVVYRAYGDQAEVEDAVQEAFLFAHKALETLESPGALRAWLARIALRYVSRRRRKRDRRERLRDLFWTSAPRHGDARQADALVTLRQVLDALPAEQRHAWILQRVADMPLEEVAAACDCSLSTVKRRIAKAGAYIERSWSDD